MDENYYKEITDMQNTWNAQWRDKRRWVVVEEGDGTYSIHEHTIDGVAPPISKSSKREAAARLLQVMGVGPIAPQHYPEEISVGAVTKEPGEIVGFPGGVK